MRLLLTLLLFLVPVLGVYTFVVADDWQVWFPENVATFGGEIDRLFYLIMWMVGIVFVLTEGVLVWCVLRYSSSRAGKSLFTHGSHKLEMIWTAVPAVALLVIAFTQMETWAAIKFDKNFPSAGEYTREKPILELYAYQFAWMSRYPDQNGRFDSPDAFEVPFDMVVPVDTDIVFHLKSRDVLHSFFVPAFRLKQDALPGSTIPMWFRATKAGEYDLICAELCGWGHYKMAGKVIVKSKADYAEWLAAQRVALYANGTQDLEEAQ